MDSWCLSIVLKVRSVSGVTPWSVTPTLVIIWLVLRFVIG